MEDSINVSLLGWFSRCQLAKQQSILLPFLFLAKLLVDHCLGTASGPPGDSSILAYSAPAAMVVAYWPNVATSIRPSRPSGLSMGGSLVIGINLYTPTKYGIRVVSLSNMVL